MTDEQLIESMLAEIEYGYISYGNLHNNNDRGLEIIKEALERCEVMRSSCGVKERQRMRLIDTDELSTVTDIREDGTEFTYIPYSEIEEAPTVYDVDKVVEQLKTARDGYSTAQLMTATNDELVKRFIAK